MTKIKNGGLDQYGAEHFEPQHFGTAGVEWVNLLLVCFSSNELEKFSKCFESVCSDDMMSLLWCVKLLLFLVTGGDTVCVCGVCTVIHSTSLYRW